MKYLGKITNGKDLVTKEYVDQAIADVDVTSQISGKEDTSNKVTSISSSSTDTQYPSAKAVYSAIESAEPDFTGLATETYVGIAINNLIDNAPTDLNTLKKIAQSIGNDSSYSTTINGILSSKANTSDLATVSTSGSYNDLLNKPTIPIATSELTNDAGFGTYTKPSDGIPKSDLSESVQGSLAKADTAIQSHQDISGKADKDTDATPGNIAKFNSSGNPIDSGFTIEKSVPADAKFTDTIQTLGDMVGSSAKGSSTNPIYWNGSTFTTISSYEGKANTAGTADKVAYELSFTVGGTSKGSYDGSEAHTIDINAVDLNISSALSYIGRTATIPTTASVTLVTGTEVTAEKGNIVIYTGDNTEYLYDDTESWVQLGSATSYSLQPHIHGSIDSQGYLTDSDGNAKANYILRTDGTGYVVPGAQIGSDTSKFLRNDGTWNTPTKSNIGLENVANLDQSKAIKEITREGTTFTYTCLDGTTGTFTQQDNNTTYAAATTTTDGLMSASDKVKLNNATSVSYSQTFIDGEELGRITIDGTETVIYGGAGGGAIDDWAWVDGTTSGPTATVGDNSIDAIPSASATTSGVVTTGEQVFAGNKTFNGQTSFDNKIILDSNTYGANLPTEAIEGQIFFQAIPAYQYDVPSGGSVGQVLLKTSVADYQCEWSDLVALPDGGTAGQLLVKQSEADGDALWQDVVALPPGGTTGQYLIKSSETDGDSDWSDIMTIYSSASTSKAYLLGTTTASSAAHETVYNSSIYTEGSVMYGAAWNDYAEYRKSNILEGGRCVIEVGDDSLELSTKRMQPGAELTSDTFGFAIGETNECKTPIAVTGRVLAYPFEDREQFKNNIGKPVCSGPNGTVSIMTDDEYKEKGYCAIGFISAVPDYKVWGQGNINVNERVWIRVR